MAQFPSYIYGLHDPGGEQLLLNAGKPGWVVVTVKVNPPDSDGNFSNLSDRGLGVIVRLNNGYGRDGTIPFAAQYDAFAQQCANFVKGSRGASIWIIGNETNSAVERPGNDGAQGGEVITPTLYARCFAKCRSAIKKLPGHADDLVAPAPPAPWNPTTTYPGNSNGDWIKYFQDILNECIKLNAPPDALAIHTYTHGMDPSLITAAAPMDPPFQAHCFQFRAYLDFLNVVPKSLQSVPIFITETQAQDWENRNIGWIRAAYQEINSWNSNLKNQAIQAVCLFRWQKNPGDPDGWNISARPELHADLRAAMQFGYRARWPSADPVGDAAIAAAQKLTWMPINTDAALYKFAQLANLGYPQTDEFDVAFGGDAYIAQVFNTGIAFVKKGDYANVMWIEKPK